MTNSPRLQYDTCYHIYNRGNNGENIFIQERNYSYFMDLYIKHIHPVADTFAYCLLRNHFHLMVHLKTEAEIRDVLNLSSEKTIKPDYPSRRFSNFFNAYAKSINKAYGRTGSLFQRPFGRIPITSSRQFWNVVTYIHQNPQKHRLVDDFRDWKWSSYGMILDERPTRLQRAATLGWFGGKADYLKLHQHWISDAESRWFAEDDL